MVFWRRRTLRRLSLLGLGFVGIVLALVSWPKEEKSYVPGERSPGITDSLARGIPADHPPVHFTEVAKEAGIDFRHFPAQRRGRLPEDMGSGVALGDADGDGWTDVFLANLAGPLSGATRGWPDGGGSCAFFHNLGNGHFEDLSEPSGLALRALANGAAWVDVDGDGDLDLFVSTYGRCYLYRNDGDLHFVDRSTASGVDAFEGFWTGVAVGDYDRDGDMDLYVCGYVEFRASLAAGKGAMKQYGTAIPALLNPSVFDPERNLLLRNRGDGTFEEVAEAAGVQGDRGRSLGAVFADFDGDGLLDLYVANDVSDNALYINRGDGSFEDRTSEALLGDYRGAMGMAVSDFDQDQDLDLYITHWVAQENALYQNVSSELGTSGERSGPLFMDQADHYGLGQAALDMVGWGTGFFDFDNDGKRDLFVINGSTIPDTEDPTQLVPQLPQLFWNAGQERGFYELGAAAGDYFRKARVGRGAALFDYDLDGDLDILLSCHGDRAYLLRNDSPREGHSLLLRLREASGNRFAQGAAVIVHWAGKAMLDQLGAQASYLSQHAVGELSFGLGSAEQMDSITVRWPEGGTSNAGPFPADRLVTWVEGSPPRVEALPGHRRGEAREPRTLDEKRRFFVLLQGAAQARIAGRLGEAERGYREALALWPGHWDCLYYLGNVLAEEGREREALQCFEELVQEHPESSRAWMQIGRIRLPGGDPDLDALDAARVAFRHCLKLNREESLPLVQLGLVDLLEGDLEKAEQRFEGAARLNPRSVAASWYRGWIAWLRGDRPRARLRLQRAHELFREEDGNEAANVDSPVDRWRSLPSRPIDPVVEYASLPSPR